MVNNKLKYGEEVMIYLRQNFKKKIKDILLMILNLINYLLEFYRKLNL